VAASATIIIPTRGRPDYLAVTLASIVTQARAAAAEVLVVDDGRDARNEQAARAVDVRYLALGSPRGANAARNAGVDAASGELLVFIDDDIEADPRWLAAYLRAAGDLPEVGVFGGPIRARLEGSRWRTCGRESPPITHTDHGLDDRDVAGVVGKPRDQARDARCGRSLRRALRRVGRGRGVGGALPRNGRADPLRRGRRRRPSPQRRGCDAPGALRGCAAPGLSHPRRYDETKGTAPSLAGGAAHARGLYLARIPAPLRNGPLLAAHSRDGCLLRSCPSGRAPPAIPAMTSSRARAARSAGRDALRCSRTGRSTCSRCPPAVALARARGASRRAQRARDLSRRARSTPAL
jgi:hypothetical protein